MPPRRCMGNRTSRKLVMPAGRQRFSLYPNLATPDFLRTMRPDQSFRLALRTKCICKFCLHCVLIVSLVAIPRIPVGLPPTRQLLVD